MTEPTHDPDQPEQQPAQQAQQQPTQPPPDAELVRQRQEYQLEVWRRDSDAWDTTEPTTLRQQLLYAKQLADADLLPPSYQQKPANVLLAFQTAAELGLPRMAALRLLNVVEGQPRLGGEGVRAAILARGHKCWTDDPVYNAHGIPVSVTAHGERKDSGQEFHATFTLDQAARARLCTVTRDEAGQVTEVRARSRHDNPLPWEQYTEDMLDHRAMTRLARRGFPDVTGGLAREDDTGDAATGRQTESQPAPSAPAAAAAASPDAGAAAGSTDDAGPELRRTDLPDPYNPADDLHVAGAAWWLHAGSDVRRRSAQQLAADRLLRAAAEGLADVPLPHPFADKVPVDWPPVTAAYIVRAMAHRGMGEDGQVIDAEVVEPGPRAMAGSVDAQRETGVDVTDPATYPQDRRPYVGEGAEGCRASAQIDREEADTLPSGPHQPGWSEAVEERRAALMASAIAWDDQANALDIDAAEAMPDDQPPALEAVPDLEVADPPADVPDPFALPLAGEPEPAPDTSEPQRADLWRQIEELAEQRGKTVEQLLARTVIAERCPLDQLSDQVLAAYLAAQRGVT